MILPLLFVPLVYGLSSTPDACAAPKATKWDTGTCYNWEYSALRTCCWQEPDINNPGETIATCQTCDTNGENCGSIFLERSPTGPLAPLEDSVLEQPEQPPLFGRNEGAVPLTGGVLQPFTSTPFQQIPQGQQQPFTSAPFQQIPQGQVQPFIQSETPPTLSPTPLPTPPSPLPPLTPTGPTVAPQDDEGGGLPATQNQENVPPGGGIAEQPEDNGQEESSEGAETAGPLT